MAGTSLLTLIDDIATLLDDVAVMTKVAAKKTAGVVGDDLAVNAEQVTGVKADRELPVVWAVAKGSAKNKLFLVPAALAISALLPWLITPLLMLGGAFLCYEGFEKVAHAFALRFGKTSEQNEAEHQQLLDALNDDDVDMVEFEQNKIRGAIRTDFILSAEIIVIALGTAQSASLLHQALVISFIAVVMTVGVYSLVAGIVKLDDAGLYLVNKANNDPSGGSRMQLLLGKGLLAFAPKLMKTLSVVGTAAMFLVGGGILLHGLPNYEAINTTLSSTLQAVPLVGAFIAIIAPSLLQLITGLLAGGVVDLGVKTVGKVKGT